MDTVSGKTDAELAQTYAATQDERAFRELVARHRHMAYRTCLRILGDFHEAQDATQAVFVVLIKKAVNLRRKGCLTGWLYDVSRQTALEALRRRERRAGHARKVAMFSKAVVGASASGDHNRTVLGILDRELAALSGVLRQVVVLRYLEGHNEREAAVLAGCPLGTMKRGACAAVAQLRKRMARRGFPLSAPSLIALLETEAHAAVPEALFSSMLAAARSVVATNPATAAASPSATSLAEGVMKVMFWTKVKVSAAAACAAVALVGVPATVTISMAAEPSAGKAGGTVQAAERTGPAKVQAKVGNESITLSVMKDGPDYFVVCPPCAGRTSCEKLDQEKAASKTSLKKGDAGFYACCAYSLGEIKRDSAKYTKLFDAELKKTSEKGSAKKL